MIEIIETWDGETHPVGILLKRSFVSRSSSSLLEIVLDTDTVQLYMMGSA